MDLAFKALIVTLLVAAALIGGAAVILAYLIAGLIAGLVVAAVMFLVMMTVAALAKLQPATCVVMESDEQAHGDMPHVAFAAKWPSPSSREPEPRGA